MVHVYVVGVGMTAFRKHSDKSVKDLTKMALDAVQSDAGAAIPFDVAFFANTAQGHLEGQSMISGQIALQSAGLEGIPVINVENACASGATAFHQALTYLKSGSGRIALAISAEKLFHPDKSKSFSLFDGAWDVHEARRNLRDVLELGKSVVPAGSPESKNRSIFMDIYAAWARYHMERFGTTQRQIAMVSAKNHWHSTMNPLAQFRNDMTVEEILAARAICWPLTLPMCAPISDGAAASILCTEDALSLFPDVVPVRVLSSALVTGVKREVEELNRHISRRAAQRAYELAGVDPKDISVAEVHDATAFAEIQQYENLGFCETGAGGSLVESGTTKLGGKLPVNTSGGLESKGHPIGATGLGQIHELVLQLRGQAGARQVPGAKLAVAENGGGYYAGEEAVACVTILGR
ncbi:Acetyl-CoA acetyltransferase [Bradyrhizobium sp. Rc2d]|uniref:thiolase family protein n=1 Tax=Bradyrhizobium sp. Rc2d TaxID=1855321 RepID=UPI00088D1702|nr:thiolase family protein [Bradyrhizobium sp. Rc2d]SDJ80217.1 Acetyl-CoA acetyltransferase [Bradyrhizobium sp. Rc2d]